MFRPFINHWKSFKKYGEGSGVFFPKVYVHYMYLRIRYSLGVREYFDNKLWNSSLNHDEFYENLHTYIHKWGYVTKHYSPTNNKLWLLVHYFDYMFAKIYCPGLDAMDYFRYQFYQFLPSKRMTFITEGGVCKMNNRLNGSSGGAKLAKIFRSKPSFNKMFNDIIGRKWILVDSSTREEFVKFCSSLQKVICKPTDGGGGKGVFVENLSTDNASIDLYDRIKGHNYIVEEVIIQHDVIARLNPTSVNTIRVYSVHSKGRICITSATLRIGNGPGVTDNYSSGGLAAEIDVEYGIVVSRAVSQSGDVVYVHPYTNVPIIGTQIPLWNKVKESVIKAHERVKDLGYIGWDVVVCNDNTITFIEANTCAGVGLQQHACLIGKKSIYSPYL